MKREFRLTRSVDFKRVRRCGKSYAHPRIVLIITPVKDSGLHIGISASRAVGNAVKRNRSKRLIRAVLQGLVQDIAPGWDLLFIAREPMGTASFQETREAIYSLLTRSHLLKTDCNHGI